MIQVGGIYLCGHHFNSDKKKFFFSLGETAMSRCMLPKKQLFPAMSCAFATSGLKLNPSQQPVSPALQLGLVLDML